MISYSHVDNKKVPLDFKLFDIIKKENGFFIELGANDGLSQSNTAFLEFSKKWKGILIEPSINKFNECKINRPNSTVLNYACVSNDYKHDTIKGDFFGHLMSSVNGERLHNYTTLTNVPAITLEKILDQFSIKTIDLLSIDTEGYELEILKGLNISKYRPKYMLVEITNDYDNITEFFTKNNYKLHSNFSNYNFIDNPGWDGTHNDYLFIDNL